MVCVKVSHVFIFVGGVKYFPSGEDSFLVADKPGVGGKAEGDAGGAEKEKGFVFAFINEILIIGHESGWSLC